MYAHSITQPQQHSLAQAQKKKDSHWYVELDRWGGQRKKREREKNRKRERDEREREKEREREVKEM